MKRSVACLLCLAICFSAGCKKKNSEETTVSSVSDSSTEVSESVKEMPTSSSEDTTTSETSTEMPEVEVKIVRDQSYLSIEKVTASDYFYPRKPTEKDYFEDEDGDLVAVIPGTGYQYDKLLIKGDEYAEIQAGLDDVQAPLINNIISDYDKECKRLKEIDESAYPDSEGSYAEFNITLHRADTKVITFEYYIRHAKSDYEGIEDKVVNISPETGEVITLSDVVADKALFEKVLSEEIRYDEDVNMTDYMKTTCIQNRHDLIENDKLEFRLYYDRIEVMMKQDSEYYANPDRFSIPVYKYPDAFNLDYFEHVPEYYMITSEKGEPIYWDIDGDGKLDILRKTPALGDDYGSAQDCILSINDNQLTYTSYNWFGYSFVQADDGRYLYPVIDGGAVGVRVNDDLSMETIEACVPFPMNAWENPTGMDPSHIARLETMHFLGLREMYRYWTVVGVKGIPQVVSNAYDNNYFIGTSDKELPAVLYDMDTKTKGKETKIPKGMVYEFIEYNIDKNEALFKISQPDSKNHDKDYYAWVEYTLNETETPDEVPTGNIGGIKETDVFDNIQYGD